MVPTTGRPLTDMEREIQAELRNNRPTLHEPHSTHIDPPPIVMLSGAKLPVGAVANTVGVLASVGISGSYVPGSTQRLSSTSHRRARQSLPQHSRAEGPPAMLGIQMRNQPSIHNAHMTQFCRWSGSEHGPCGRATEPRGHAARPPASATQEAPLPSHACGGGKGGGGAGDPRPIFPRALNHGSRLSRPGGWRRRGSLGRDDNKSVPQPCGRLRDVRRRYPARATTTRLPLRPRSPCRAASASTSR